MIGFRNPFPVRLPCPVRWGNGEMEPDTIQFDGMTIRITYHARPVTRGWWDGRAIHEIDWLPGLRTPEAVLAHYAEHRPGLNRAQRDRLERAARFTKCGWGQKVRLSPKTAGIRAAGARDAIYLISEAGLHGSLRLWSSMYQSYRLSQFKIGAVGSWNDLPVIGHEPMTIHTNHPS